jgi:hypothetical protein
VAIYKAHGESLDSGGPVGYRGEELGAAKGEHCMLLGLGNGGCTAIA